MILKSFRSIFCNGFLRRNKYKKNKILNSELKMSIKWLFGNRDGPQANRTLSFNVTFPKTSDCSSALLLRMAIEGGWITASSPGLDRKRTSGKKKRKLFIWQNLTYLRYLPRDLT